MFHHIDYEAEFPPSLIHPTGRKLSGKFDLQKGLTAITGRNESGKSFSLEMIRFALFGSAALRGTATDYVSINVRKFVFTIRGVAHTIERTLRKAVLKRGEDVIATGTSPVNEKIVGLLGFGLDVFDVACSANQHDVMRITSMKPTERRRLIDSVVGIGALEVVGKWAMTEANLRERDAQSKRSILVLPIAPDKPDVPEDARLTLAAAEAFAKEYAELTGWLANVQTEPTAPVCPINMPSENLRGFANQRAELRAKVEGLRARIRVLPDTKPQVDVAAVRGLIEAWEKYSLAQNWLRVHPRPTLTLDEAVAGIQQWAAYNSMLQVQATNQVYERQMKALTEQALSCPNCKHTWHAEQDRIEELEKLILPVPSVQKPTHSLVDYTTAKQQWERFDQALHDAYSAVPAAANPGLTLVQLQAVEKAIEMHAERLQLEAELEPLAKRLEGDKDWEAMLNQRLAYESAHKEYIRVLLTYQQWFGARQLKEARAAAIKPVADSVPDWRAKVAALDIYERDLARYQREVEVYNGHLKSIIESEAQAEQYRRVAEAMTRLRSKVKQFLLPSLNRVASALIARMTGGTRTSIIIDEDFEILVDGQKVHTLSGSGIVCTNLAIRLALGQVLVNGVISVFLGDEIDGSMDDFRAEETALTLRTLVNSVSQILIVSHKHPEADHTIQLG